jgi:phosphoenolpyruvate---glycerone phosphotransferase subunit DhaL
VQARGKAEPGDKTMLDALLPALEALRAAQAEGSSVAQALDRSATAAEEGMRATAPLEARKGRASYLGPRSVGHQDPGATSSALLLRSAADAFASH